MSDRARTAIVTGGSSGIGLATVRRLLEDGCNVTLCSRSEERVQEAVGEVGTGAPVLAVAADVSRPDDAGALVERTVERFGALDVLVNAHGIQGTVAPLADLTLDQWQEVLSANLLGVVATTTAAIPQMRAAGGGAIVNVSSIDYMQAEHGIAAYGVSKAGVVAFTRYAACELASDGIRVNAVAPGWVRTSMTAPFLEEAGALEAPVDTNMLGRVGEPQELANAIAFLAGPDASYVTGETLVIDGGQTVMLRELRLRESR
jgi:meso-butanediol dehydrogenase/(S,S)-butanediol dehydrogenase/diacetyl reductase